jgi:hypothetical protein
LSVLARHTFIFVKKAESIHLLLEKKLCVTHFFDPDPPKHLPYDHLDMLVVDMHTLKPVDLLNRIDKIPLQLLHTADRENVVRIERAVHKRFARPYAIAFLDVDVRSARDRILPLLGVITHYDDLL